MGGQAHHYLSQVPPLRVARQGGALALSYANYHDELERIAKYLRILCSVGISSTHWIVCRGCGEPLFIDEHRSMEMKQYDPKARLCWRCMKRP